MIELQPGDGRRLFGVLPTFRRPAELANALLRVAEQDRALDGLVVIDNSPGAETESIVKQHASLGHAIEYIASPENLGFAGGVELGMNRVLEFAEDDDWIVVFDDDDPLPSPTVFSDLERFSQTMVSSDPTTAVVGLVGARFDWKRGGLVRVPDWELRGPVEVDFIGGNHFPFYRVSAIRKVGAFSKDIFFGLSEIEHGLRLRRAGFSVYAHGSLWRERREQNGRLDLEMQPSRRLSELNWRRYYSLRNVIYILRYHGKLMAAVRVTIIRGLIKPLANLGVHPRLALRHLALNGRACRDGWLGRMGRTIEPDGLARPEA